MDFLRLFGVGDARILRKNCCAKGVVTAVKRCWWMRIKTQPARLYASDENTAYSHIITFQYQVDGHSYEGKRYIDARYCVPQKGENIRIYYDPKYPKRYAVYAFGPGITKIGW